VLNRLSRFIERHLQPADDVSPLLSDHQKKLASAALLVEVAMADQEFSDAELEQLIQTLQQKFELGVDETLELVDRAKAESHDASSLHQFTQLINQHCDEHEKFALIKAMWEVAYADGHLDKYEDYIIRKVADLIYVSHSDFIRAKSLTKAQLG
jgi:uncharacterized tellurite resistance protein B-like protein